MSDQDVDIDNMTLDDVAASLLVNEKEPEKEPVKKTAPKGETADETTEAEEPDQSVDEVKEDDTASEEAEEDTETENEDDIDVDELEVEVVVDGEEKKVKLKDLKANYSGNGAIEKRLQEASEIRNKTLEVGRHLYSALQEESNRLKHLDEIVQKLAEPEVDWEELKRTNLPKYLLERDRQREAQVRREAVQKESARIRAEQERLERLAQEQYTADQAKQLVSKLPDLANPENAQATFAKLTKAASTYGYAPDEVGGVLDHRALLVLNDAMKYQEMISKQGKTQKRTAPATALLRPGASSAKPVNSAKKLKDALIKRARSSGKAEDVAATLLVRR